MYPEFSRNNVRSVLLTQKKISPRLTSLAHRLSITLKEQPRGNR